MIQTMNETTPRPETQPAPQAFRDALSALVQFGLRVAGMIAEVADAETALAKSAAEIRVAEGVPAMATSLAEAIEADRATAAAAEARHSVVARAEAIAAAFARVSRAIRLTVAMAERLDRGWASGGAADDRHAKTVRQIARGAANAAGRESEGERPTESLTEREAPDWEDEFGDRSPEEVVAIICRALRLDPVRMTASSPVPGIISQAEIDAAVPLFRGGRDRPASPPQRPPDG
jgi:hypothetical protein